MVEILGIWWPISLKGWGNVLTSSLASSSCSNIFTRTLSIFQLSSALFWLYFQGDFSQGLAKKSTSNSRLALYQFFDPSRLRTLLFQIMPAKPHAGFSWVQLDLRMCSSLNPTETKARSALSGWAQVTDIPVSRKEVTQPSHTKNGGRLVAVKTSRSRSKQGVRPKKAINANLPAKVYLGTSAKQWGKSGVKLDELFCCSLFFSKVPEVRSSSKPCLCWILTLCLVWSSKLSPWKEKDPPRTPGWCLAESWNETCHNCVTLLSNTDFYIPSFSSKAWTCFFPFESWWLSLQVPLLEGMLWNGMHCQRHR